MFARETTPGVHLLQFRDLVNARYKSRVGRIRYRRDPAGFGRSTRREGALSSVEFCELVQWVAVPEWEEGGLVLVKQTFVGPHDVLMGRLRAVSDVSGVSRREN